MTDKGTLRATLRARRDAAPPATLPVPAAFLARLVKGSVIASYLPIGSEADPSPFVAAALRLNCTIALPHVVDRATPMRFLALMGEFALVTGPFGLRQPPADAPEIDPVIILTPLIGFDRMGHRIGQGAGHYDRAFPLHPNAWRVGIARAVQEVDHIAADAWDIPLHAIATEQEWITPTWTT
jgi:5-formyltetrahydrofolate cyclo-ligase